MQILFRERERESSFGEGEGNECEMGEKLSIVYGVPNEMGEKLSIVYLSSFTYLQ